MLLEIPNLHTETMAVQSRFVLNQLTLLSLTKHFHTANLPNPLGVLLDSDLETGEATEVH